MKKYLLAFVICLSSYALFALDASVSYVTFKSPGQNYVELYLHVVGQTVVFAKPEDGEALQAAVEVTLLFKQGDDIVKYDKYRLTSPPTNTPIDFISLKRYGLANGAYDLDVILTDLNNSSDTKTYAANVSMDYAAEPSLQQSDIQLLASYQPSAESENPFVKNGYYLEPLPFNFYGKRSSKLVFYNELYHAKEAIAGEEFGVRYAIESLNTSTGESEVVSVVEKRRPCRDINVLLLPMDIGKLPSGNYRLRVEIRATDGQLLSEKTADFQRSNPYLRIEEMNAGADSTSFEEEFVAGLDSAELRYGLKAIAPLISGSEVEVLNSVISNQKLEAQRFYLFTYWAARSPNHPEEAYKKYMEVARAVDNTYRSGFGYGFETDRGYMFLKYGRPSDKIAVEDEPSAPPYEIWVYYQITSTRQTNVKFIFYNPSLAHNDYRLLHSTARGEFQNPQWEVELYRDNPTDVMGNNPVDNTRMKDNYHRNARRYFNDL